MESKPLDFHKRLIFFEATRKKLVEDMIQTLPTELYHNIFCLLCTLEIELLQKVNQLSYSYSSGTHRVKLPYNWGVIPQIKLILTPNTKKSEKFEP